MPKGSGQLMQPKAVGRRAQNRHPTELLARTNRPHVSGGMRKVAIPRKVWQLEVLVETRDESECPQTDGLAALASRWIDNGHMFLFSLRFLSDCSAGDTLVPASRHPGPKIADPRPRAFPRGFDSVSPGPCGPAPRSGGMLEGAKGLGLGSKMSAIEAARRTRGAPPAYVGRPGSGACM